MEKRRDPTIQALSLSHQCVLEWHEIHGKEFSFVGTHATLEPDLAGSPRDVFNPIQVREFWASMMSQFWSHRTPMNSAVNFSFILIKTTSQSHDQFWKFGWKSIFLVEFVGGNINPLPFSHKNSLFHIVHGIRKNKFLRRMSFLDAGLVQLWSRRFVFFCNGSLSLAVIPCLCDWVLVRDEVTLPRSGSVLSKWLPKTCAWAKLWYLNFQFHNCQETA